MALRLSLGASRARLVRQLVTESLAVAILGGAAAMVVASTLHGLIVQMLAQSDSRFAIAFSLDSRVLAFAIGATVVALAVFGVLPALQVTRTSTATSLNDERRGTTTSRKTMRAGRWLVACQLALSLPLLFGAGLLTRTAWNVQHADLGFLKDHLLVVRVDLREVTTDEGRRRQLRTALLDEIRRLPGVGAASYSQLGLFTGGESSETIAVDGYTPKGDADRGSAVDTVGPEYFSTLGIRLRAGRDIQESDRADALKVCVINEAFARRFFDGRNPIGRHVSTVEDSNERTTYEIVGVAADARTSGLRRKLEPRFFVPVAQRPNSGTTPILIIRASDPTGPILDAVRTTVRRIDASLPITAARTIEEQMAPFTAQDRMTATLAMIFGGVALVLAAVGLYGVLSYGVAKRTNEIAIRIALGALPGRVVSMILRETTGLVIAGFAIGGALAYETSRLIGSRLYGVAPQDPLTLVVTIGVLLAAALTAAFLPARRASRLDPIKALRM
jgi:predicted permease